MRGRFQGFDECGYEDGLLWLRERGGEEQVQNIGKNTVWH
jgi:hypothetical protein